MKVGCLVAIVLVIALIVVVAILLAGGSNCGASVLNCHSGS